MSELREQPTREPRQPSSGGSETYEQGQLTPEQALEQAREAQRFAEQDAQRERDRAARAMQERDQALNREQNAAAESISARERTILADIDSAKTQAEQAKQAIAYHNAAGDAQAVANAFDQLADARARMDRLNNQRQWFESERERVKNQPQPQPQAQNQPVQEGHRVRFASGVEIRATDQVKSWVEKHPRMMNDTGYEAHASSAHARIVGDGVREGSPAYFRALDDAMEKFERYEAFERGELQPQERQMSNGQRRHQPPASSTAAPVTRGTVSPGSRGDNLGEMEIARHLGADVNDMREFARIAGFSRRNGYKTDDEGYQAYLDGHREIIRRERAGLDTGLKVEGVYR